MLLLLNYGLNRFQSPKNIWPILCVHWEILKSILNCCCNGLLIKYCINSFPQVDKFILSIDSFIWLIDWLINWKLINTISVYCICDWSLRYEMKYTVLELIFNAYFAQPELRITILSGMDKQFQINTQQHHFQLSMWYNK